MNAQATLLPLLLKQFLLSNMNCCQPTHFALAAPLHNVVVVAVVKLFELSWSE
jgi:hypothetical protein